MTDPWASFTGSRRFVPKRCNRAGQAAARPPLRPRQCMRSRRPMSEQATLPLARATTSGSEDELRDTKLRIARLLDIRTGAGDAPGNRIGDTLGGIVDFLCPCFWQSREADLLLELVTVKLSQRSVEIQPQIEFEVDIAVVVLAYLSQGP